MADDESSLICRHVLIWQKCCNCQSGQVRWYRTWTHGWLILQDQKPVGFSFLPFSSRFDSEIASFLNQITIVIIKISYACKLLIQGLHVWWLQLKFLMWCRNALGGFPPFWIHWRPVTSWNEQLRQITVGTASRRCHVLWHLFP